MARRPAGAAAPAVRLKMQRAQLLATLMQGQVGTLAEACVRGELEIEGEMPDVMALTAAMSANPLQRTLGQRAGHAWRRLATLWRHRLARDVAQVRQHDDVSDAFYALWLDPLRVYSCAYYAQPGMALAQAQQTKLELVCRKLQLAPGQRFLDLGCGWGALLLWAARAHGVQALGITLSRNQHVHVSRLIE